MTAKKKILYKKIFSFLRDNFNLNPKKSMSDFEAGMRNAIKETWEDCVLLGCDFHFKQALRRKMSSISGLKGHISRNIYAANVLKLFMSLPFLPQKFIAQGFSEIVLYQRRHHQSHKFLKFNKYFVRTWLHSIRSYKIDDHRTNNIPESFNAKLKRHIHRNPSSYAFLSMSTI